MAESRITESKLYPEGEPESRVRWVTGPKPIELLRDGEYHYFTAEEAYLTGNALCAHAVACGYDPENA